MKRVICVLLAALILIGMFACAGPDAVAPGTSPTPAPGTEEPGGTQPEGEDPASTSGYTYMTSSDNRVYESGTFDTSAITYPVLVTSFGQSADVSMLDALFKKLDKKVEYVFNPLATAEEVAQYQTVVIAAGMSSKGLGAAGISEDSEFSRAGAIIETIQQNNTLVIFAHLGGASRRGGKSDKFADMVLDKASYLLVVEEGNESDSKFSNFAVNSDLPYSMVYTIADCLAPLNKLFG